MHGGGDRVRWRDVGALRPWANAYPARRTDKLASAGAATAQLGASTWSHGSRRAADSLRVRGTGDAVMGRREFRSHPRPYAARAMRVGLDLARLPLPRLLAIALVLGQHGMASGPNPSLNPPGLSPPSPGRPLSSSGPDAAAISQQHVQQQQQQPSSSPDNSPSASVRFRGVGQGILVPDMYATINEGFHAARSPDVYFLPTPRAYAASVLGFPRTPTVLGHERRVELRARNS